VPILYDAWAVVQVVAKNQSQISDELAALINHPHVLVVGAVTRIQTCMDKCLWELFFALKWPKQDPDRNYLVDGQPPADSHSACFCV